MLFRLNSFFNILILCFIFALIPNAAQTGLFKKPWSDLEKDYLALAVSPDLTYFDGSWSGYMKCGRVKSYKGFTTFRSFEIEKGAGIFKGGVKGKNGYRHWKIKIKNLSFFLFKI